MNAERSLCGVSSRSTKIMYYPIANNTDTLLTISRLNRKERMMFKRIRMAYICRGCGAEIVNKGSFKKCPVCGIKYD